MKMGRDGTSGSAFPAVITQLTVTGHITYTFRQVHSYVSISVSVFFYERKDVLLTIFMFVSLLGRHWLQTHSEAYI